MFLNGKYIMRPRRAAGAITSFTLLDGAHLQARYQAQGTTVGQGVIIN